MPSQEDLWEAPRHNWIEILSLAGAPFILLEATLPNLKSEEWEECFNRRFLPGWRKWQKESSWKVAFLGYVQIDSSAHISLKLIRSSILYRVYHR